MAVRLRYASVILVLGFLSASCMEQYNMFPWWKKLDEERAIAHRELPQLTAEGKLPADAAGGGEKQTLSKVDKNFNNFCSSCHGMDGDGKGPAGSALNPKPRNFHDEKWQKSVDDAHIAKVIKEGGAAVGLSPSMAPWGAVLKDEDIKEMVAKIRAYTK